MLKFFCFIIAIVPFWASSYSILGAANRNSSSFPIVYWEYDNDYYISNDLNPCYRVSNCYIVYGELFSENRFSTYNRYPTNKSATNYPELWDFMSNMSLRFSGTKYNAITATVPDGIKYPCVNLGYQIGSSSPTPINPMSCTPGPGGSTPPPVTCTINSQDITLQHPAIMANELNGNRKEVNINVSCNRNSSINLRMTGLSGNGRLALAANGSLYSELTINNVSAQSGVTVTNVGTGGKNITIASALVSSGEVASGKYSASAVLLLTIP